jgi:hypothetical protein
MTDRILPRSPRETMDGWVYLPRYVDKIRLHLAGRLHPDYHENLGKGMDAVWLRAVGLTHDAMVEVVRGTLTDGEVCDWVRRNVRRSPAEKEAHRHEVMDFPPRDNPAALRLFEKRKADYGLGGREDVRVRPDLLDADEGRM